MSVAVGYRPTRSYTLDESAPEFILDLPKNVAMMGLLCRISGELSIATGEDGIRSESVLRLLPRFGVSSPLGVHYPDDFPARLHAALTRRLTAQDPVYSEPADATSQSNTGIEAEFMVTFSPEWLAGGPADMHIPPISPDEVFQLVGEWDTSKTNSASDAGTGAIVEDTNASGNAVTWDTLPSVEITPIYAHSLPKPFAIPRVTRSRGDVFSAADTQYSVPIRTKLDIAMTLFRAYENGNEEDLADLIDRVTVGDRHDFSRVAREALAFRERKAFPAVTSSRPGELGILHADNGKLGGRILPVQDLQQDEFKLEVTAPSVGDGKVEAVMFHTVRMSNAGVTRPNLPRRAGGRG